MTFELFIQSFLKDRMGNNLRWIWSLKTLIENQIFPNFSFLTIYKSWRKRQIQTSSIIKAFKFRPWTFFHPHKFTSPNRRPLHWWHWTVVNETMKIAVSRFSCVPLIDVKNRLNLTSSIWSTLAKENLQCKLMVVQLEIFQILLAALINVNFKVFACRFSLVFKLNPRVKSANKLRFSLNHDSITSAVHLIDLCFAISGFSQVFVRLWYGKFRQTRFGIIFV